MGEINVFRRYEKKYRISAEQRDLFFELISREITPDEYGPSLICSLYYDSDDSHLIERSLEKPVYKEKLRVRSYGVPTDQDKVFVEIKKKFKGIVYKRRVVMSCAAAKAYLDGLPYDDAILLFPLISGSCPAEQHQQGIVSNREQTPIESFSANAPSLVREHQISCEIDWFISHYYKLKPAMFITSERVAYIGTNEPNLRITFDNTILWRSNALDFSYGVGGTPLLSEDEYLMEIKISGAFPLWLVRALSAVRAYPASFSKYGFAYKASYGDYTWDIEDDIALERLQIDRADIHPALSLV